MKKKTIGIGVRSVNVIYRDTDSLKEITFEFSKSMSYAECTQRILEDMKGYKVEAMKTKDLGIKKYEVDMERLRRWLEEETHEQDNCNRESDTGWENWTVQ